MKTIFKILRIYFIISFIICVICTAYLWYHVFMLEACLRTIGVIIATFINIATGGYGYITWMVYSIKIGDLK